ncbi:MAG: sigma-70 family RNA polymerase sigma factor [Planctomycetes bacterium]|nr:sigma-70 family RNA polymerase sigma factor [Planctomycetota bacterium]
MHEEQRDTDAGLDPEEPLRSLDPAALESLFARNLPRLEAFLRAKAGGVALARESVRDLAQSVCREVLEDFDKLEWRGEKAFRSWLFLEATRKVLKRARAASAQKRDIAREEGVDDVLDGFAASCASMLTPSRQAAAREEVDLLDAALEALPSDQRDAIMMSRMLGIEYSEIATTLGKSESAVRGLVARGLSRLASIRERWDTEGR